MNLSLNSITTSNRIAGAEISLSDSTGICLTILKKEKSSIVTELSKEGIKSVEELSKDIPANTALQISLTGKGIIHRKLHVETNSSDKTYLQAIFPNANISDFYIQKTNTARGEVFVSVIRKQTLDEILTQLKDKGVQVIACYLGPFAINSIVPLLNKEELNFAEEVSSKQVYQLKFSNNLITDLSIVALAEMDYQTTDTLFMDTVSIGDESIRPSLLIPFATAFSYFLPAPAVSSNIEAVVQQKEEYRQKNIFQKSVWITAGFFFVLLMGNFILFNSYFTKKNELSTQLSFNQEKLNKYESLKKEYDDKKQVIEKLGLSKSSRTSWYADQLAVDMPNTILLSKLLIYPAVKRTTPDETVFEFNTDVIKVEGSCSKSIEVNEWIKTIQKKKWIKEVNMSNYNQDKETGRGEFMLELRLK